MIHDFKASGEEKRGRLLLLIFFLFGRREVYEAFIYQSTVKNRIRYSVKKIVKSKKRLKYEKFFSKRHLKMKARKCKHISKD